MSIEAMKQALEALEDAKTHGLIYVNEIVDLRQAIADTEKQEPVAIPDCGEAGHDEGCCGNAQCLPSARRTTPQPKREPL